MTHFRKIFLVSLMILPFYFSNVAAAECPHCTEKGQKGKICKMCKERNKMEEKMMADLKVTPEQKTKLDDLKTNHKNKIDDLKKQMKEKREDLRNELAKENYEPANLDSLKNSIKEIAGTIAAERTNVIIEMRKILTKEQFDKLEAKRSKMKEMKPPRNKMDKEMHPPRPPEEE